MTSQRIPSPQRAAEQREPWSRGFIAQLLLPDGQRLPRPRLTCEWFRLVLFWDLGLLSSSPPRASPRALKGRWQGLDVWIPCFIFYFFFFLKNFWMPTWLFCLQEIMQNNAKGDREEDSALPSKGRFLGGPSFTSLHCYEQIDFVCVCVLAQRSQLANAERGANSVQIAPSHQHTLYLLVGRFTRCKESEKEGHCLALTLPLLEKEYFPRNVHYIPKNNAK